MNRILIVVFDTESAAEKGVRLLRELHGAGSLTLYAMGVITKDDHGKTILKDGAIQDFNGYGVGLAVGSIIGLLAGPLGMVVGAIAGSVAGAVHDYWVAGVGLDFVEDARSYLKPNNTALVAEVEEEWVTPVDIRMAAIGGMVFRRTRSEVAEAHLHADISALKVELKLLDAELSHSADAVNDKLHTVVTAIRARLESTLHGTQLKIAAVKKEAYAKLHALLTQWGKAEGDIKLRLEARIEQVNIAMRTAAIGGLVFSRRRSETAEAYLHADISALKVELKLLDAELSHSADAVNDKLRASAIASKVRLESTLHGTQLEIVAMQEEAYAKLHTLLTRWGKAEGDVRLRLEEQIQQLNIAFHERCARMSAAPGVMPGVEAPP